MNIWLIIGLIAVVGGIIALFALRKKGIIDKPKPPAYDGNFGITIPPTLEYAGLIENGNAVGAPIWIDTKFNFAETPEDQAKRKILADTVNRAAKDALRLADHYNPDWKDKLPPVTEMHVYFIEKMATAENGDPALLVTAYANDGTRMSNPVKTAGTVLNARERMPRPSVGNPTNPYTVQPIWDDWGNPSVYNYVFNEFEHLIEIWQSWEEFFKWSGPNDVHPHRPEI